MALVDDSGLQAKVNERWRQFPKLYLPKQLIPLLGYTATSVLAHLQWEFSEGNRLQEQADGKMALRQSIVEMAKFIACPSRTLLGKKGAMQRLLDLKLVFSHKPSHGRDRSTLWLLNYDRIDSLLTVADALCLSPSPEAWQTWKIENPVLFKKFSSLAWNDIEKSLPFNVQPQMPQRNSSVACDEIHQMPEGKNTGACDEIHQMPCDENHQMNKKRDKEEKKTEAKASEQPSAGDGVFESSSMEKKPLTVKSEGQKKAPFRPDPFIEHWNTLPHVPKCRPKTKTYEFCRKFFEAHRQYKAGECKGFMLTEDIRQKIKLDKINKRPEEATIRPEKEMYAHIEQAALAYDPKYAPINKQWLGRSLKDFLYRDGQYGKTGTISLFLKKITSPPLPIEDDSYETLINNADDWELEIAESIKKVYLIANGRSMDDDLSLPELKKALSIANKIALEYTKIPTDRISIFANHFPDYREFMVWWKNYCEEHVWQGMPITALDTSKDMWRRFVDHVSNDIGWHLFEGTRVH